MEQIRTLAGSMPGWIGYGYGIGNGYGYGVGCGNGYGDGNGYGYGYGYGYGIGNGYGYGVGCGNGYGYGVGYGNGYGYGIGNGYGYGVGCGNGYGYGVGYGNGDGIGYGDGDGAYWLSTVRYFAETWTVTQRTRLAALTKAGATIAFWLSDLGGLPANGGGRIEPAAPGVVHTVPGPLTDTCRAGSLHATRIPPKWKGDRWWVVALIGEVIGDDEKLGALTREIIGECL